MTLTWAMNNQFVRDFIEYEGKHKLLIVKYNLAVPSSSWYFLCLPVQKLDGTRYYCTDYWKVKAVTKPDFYTLSHIEDWVGATKLYV